MANYNITVSNKSEELLKAIADASGTSIGEILGDYIDSHLQNDMVDLVVKQYRDGKLTAMKAWKLSGLSFDEFNALAKE